MTRSKYNANRVLSGPVERVKHRMTLSERLDFYSMPEPNSGCQLWLASVNDKGYGHFYYGSTRGKAHRASWVAEHGPIPDGLHVLHKCDVPSCINPDHLFLGTHDDNMADMVAKERYARGSKVGNATATLADVRLIRAGHLEVAELVRQTGLSETTVRNIQTRKTWTHVD